jgi:hypothetical protein
MARPAAAHACRIWQFNAFPFVTGPEAMADAVNPASDLRVLGLQDARSRHFGETGVHQEKTT